MEDRGRKNFVEYVAENGEKNLATLAHEESKYPKPLLSHPSSRVFRSNQPMHGGESFDFSRIRDIVELCVYIEI